VHTAWAFGTLTLQVDARLEQHQSVSRGNMDLLLLARKFHAKETHPDYVSKVLQWKTPIGGRPRLNIEYPWISVLGMVRSKRRMISD